MEQAVRAPQNHQVNARFTRRPEAGQMPSPRNHRLTYEALKRAESVFRYLSRYIRVNHLLFVAVFVLSGLSFYLAYEFRFDFDVPRGYNAERLLLLPYVASFKVLLFYLLRSHATHWRYIGLADLPRLILHSFLGSVALVLIRTFSVSLVVPKGVILGDFFMSLVLIGGARVGLRFLRETAQVMIRRGETFEEREAVVVGAGDSGEVIVREIVRNPQSRIRVRALFDDDRAKKGRTIHGVKVVGGLPDVAEYVTRHGIQMAIVAIPSATASQMQRIYNTLKDLNISVKTLPALHEIIEGSPALTQLRDIDITDLLGREEIHIDSDQIRNMIQGKVVVVTGSGGSIGSELCRQVLKRSPERIILIERAENSLFHIHRQLLEQLGHSSGDRVVPVLCDVRDRARIEFEFEHFRPDLVFHAGAHKHVPLQEMNPVECFTNNVLGFRTLVRASEKCGVSTFLLISTDKAVRPKSVMGASKRICELYCQALGNLTSTTKFLSVRFGNVLASEGSVVPLFLNQISKGGPITITHPDMRRYFMTIPEAVTLVLQAAALGKSGQIMTLEMGEPIRIVDMVHQLVQLVGKNPEEIPIEYIGIRPGEKLVEELYSSGEIPLDTGHKKIRAFDPNKARLTQVIERIDRSIDLVVATNDPREVRSILKKIVPEYDPDPDPISSSPVK